MLLQYWSNLSPDGDNTARALDQLNNQLVGQVAVEMAEQRQQKPSVRGQHCVLSLVACLRRTRLLLCDRDSEAAAFAVLLGADADTQQSKKFLPCICCGFTWLLTRCRSHETS